MSRKDYYFHFTGEVRQPKKGEWYTRGDMESIQLANRYFTEDGITRYIYTCHEIDVPEIATELFITGNVGYIVHLRRISIERPKPKVKKWHFCFEDSNSKDGWSATAGDPYTEKEMKEEYPNAKWYHKIDETMIEVDE